MYRGIKRAMEATLSTAIESMGLMRNNVMHNPKGSNESAQKQPTALDGPWIDWGDHVTRC